MKKLILFSFILLHVLGANAQSTNWQWAKSVGATSEVEGRSIKADANGNSYVTGRFKSPTITFDTITLINADNTGSTTDVFIVKYNIGGSVLWAKSAGGNGNDDGQSVSTDTSGNVFVTGAFNSPTLTFGTTTLTNAGINSGDIFLVKFSTSGNVLWAKSVGGAANDLGYSTSPDISGNVLITGAFNSPSITFGTTTLNNSDNTGSTTDIFLVKYSSSGNVLWAKSAGGVANDYGYGVSSDISGNVLITGSFNSPTITFGTTTIANAGSNSGDVFLVKYNPSGNVLWAKSAGGTGDDGGRSVSTDSLGRVFVTGYFNSPTIIFGTNTLSNAGASDIFIVVFVSFDGSVDWAQRVGGTGNDEGNCVSNDENGNCYITGYFQSSTITFANTTLTNSGAADIFVLKYDGNSYQVWAKSSGGVGNDLGCGVSTSTFGNVLLLFITGSFNSSPYMAFGSTNLPNSNAGGGNVFIVRYFASSGSMTWAKSASGFFNDEGKSITTDVNGNTYVTGYFDSPAIAFGTTTLQNAGGFVVKYSPSGNVLWAQRVGDYGNSVSTDTSGNVFVVGYFNSSTITLGTTTLTNSGSNNNDIFIVKYDPTGSVLWAKSAGGTSGKIGHCSSTDPSGNVLVIGSFLSGTITFETDTFSSGLSNIFLAKYSASGNLLWAQSFGGSDDDDGRGVSTDASGNVLITGGFKSPTITFGAITLTNTGGSHAFFIVKCSPSGNALWAKSAGGSNVDMGRNVSTDASGNILVTGMFSSPAITFGTTTLNNVDVPNLDVFIVKYSASGNVLWAKSAGAIGSEFIGQSSSTSVSGNIMVIGSFHGTLTFGTTTLTSVGANSDIFIAQYSTSGNALWAKSLWANPYSTPQGLGVSTDPYGNVLVTGSFYITLTFGTITLTSSGGSDIFVAKICQMAAPTITPSGATTFCQGNSVTLTASSSNSYLWSNGATSQSISVSASSNDSVTVTNVNGCSATSSVTTVVVNPLPTATITPNGATTFCQGNSVMLTAGNTSSYLWSNGATTQSISVSSSGNDSVTVTNGSGCSATSAAVAVSVTPLPTTPTITQNGTVLTSNSTTGNQWYLDGNIITGATSATYTTTQNGSYTVIVNVGGCTSASSSPVVITVGIDKLSNNNYIAVYPNPTNGVFIIEQPYTKGTIEIYNVVGKMVFKSEITNSKSEIDLSKESSGIYFMHFITNKGRETQKIILTK